MTVAELLTRIARRDRGRSEATLQADIRQLLLDAPLSLTDGDLLDPDLESPVTGRRRIDIEAGSCLIEVKRDLSAATVYDEAVKQLAGYLDTRQRETGCRYVGILTDGHDWRCLSLPGSADNGPPREVSIHRLAATNPDTDEFLIWLEGVLATARDVPATPREIERRLGAGSSAHALDRDTLLQLYRRHADHPAVRMKRQLWAKLLETALGTQFDKTDDGLFVEHTYLVNTAEVIAHAVVGIDPTQVEPASLLGGGQFEQSGIAGVVEADFFDWPAHVPDGPAFVRSLARRVARFNWEQVGGDVLKVLYESVITAATRKSLGEYYTPDWLAERVVAEAVDRPLEQRVLDPACGSGTFLFHAVRRFLAAADAAELKPADALERLTSQVIGLDLHPVAVTLARVTYLLAIGRDRLDRRRGEVRVPVFLGDAVQWRREADDLFTKGNLVIETDDEKGLFADALTFPEPLVEDPGRFAQLVEALADKACGRKPGGPAPKLAGLFQQFGVPPEFHDALTATFRTLCDLHDDGRDHIWGYYVRNLARPWWLALPANRVDVLVGNPPWLAYRHMPQKLQEAFKSLSDERGLWHGAKVATHQDLSGLFLVRAVERYLRDGGRFALVMPNAAVDRGQFRGLRTGSYPQPGVNQPLAVAFDPAWDLRRLRPHFFPIASCVLFGTRATAARPLPTAVQAWSGQLPARNATWAAAGPHLTRAPGEVRPAGEDAVSPWADRFRNGATVFPRMLFFVTRLPPGPLGLPKGQSRVRSLQRSNDKQPWKGLPPLEGVIESEFIRPVLLGESVLPYRVAETFEAVLPLIKKELMDGQSDRLDSFPRLSKWWREAERMWEAHRKSGTLTLSQQLDYQSKLKQQLPMQPERIVYTASGMHLAAARLSDRRAAIEHGLYWATAASTAEGQYLCAVLNAATFTELVRPLMSYGKDERHFDKHIWQLPVPLFDPADDRHQRLAARGAELEELVGGLGLSVKHFATVRREVRVAIAGSEAGQEVEELVAEMLG